MDYSFILAILFTHFVADFLVQTEWQAVNKWRNNEALTRHVLSYILVTCFLWGALMGLDAFQVVLLAVITFTLHYIQDYFTSKLNHILAIEARRREKWHWFFASVGFDQLLHGVQLFYTYKLINHVHY